MLKYHLGAGLNPSRKLRQCTITMWTSCVATKDPYVALHFQKQGSAIVHINYSFCHCTTMVVWCWVVVGAWVTSLPQLCPVCPGHLVGCSPRPAQPTSASQYGPLGRALCNMLGHPENAGKIPLFCAHQYCQFMPSPEQNRERSWQAPAIVSIAYRERGPNDPDIPPNSGKSSLFPLLIVFSDSPFPLQLVCTWDVNPINLAEGPVVLTRSPRRGYLKPNPHHWRLSSLPMSTSRDQACHDWPLNQKNRSPSVPLHWEMLHKLSLPSTAGGCCPCPLLGTGVRSLCQRMELQQPGGEGSFLSPPVFAVFTHIFHASSLPHTAPGFLSVRAPALSEFLHEDFLFTPCQM